MELRDKRVMVIGLGVSGLAAARLLAAHDAALVLTDARLEIAREQIPSGEIHLGGDDPAWLEGVELVVASPGVPPISALMRAARASGLPIIGELELASRYLRAPIVAVTGTNGKSTVTVMLGEIFKAAGMKTFVGGNLGTPLSDAAGDDFDVAVAEVSSYQLETIDTFAPAVGVHLNLTDDHLDRYRSLEEYGLAKARLFAKQDSNAWAVLNRDDPHVWKLRDAVRAGVFSFGRERPAHKPAAWCSDDAIFFDDGKRPGIIDIENFKLPGTHNLSNAMAAASAALSMGVEPKTIERALAEFRGLPHRIEFVCDKNGVTYIDDSKGTNVGAAVEALEAVKGPVILIAGGMDKGGSYTPLRKAVERRGVKLITLVGAAKRNMTEALRGAAPIKCVETLAEAVSVAAANAETGDTVLLSPACSSFDQFKDYAERGRIFQDLVRAL